MSDNRPVFPTNPELVSRIVDEAIIKTISCETKSKDAFDPYKVMIGGVLCDPCRIAREFKIEDPVIFQALKKILRLGRKHKSTKEDVREAVTSLERWEAMNLEDEQS